MSEKNPGIQHENKAEFTEMINRAIHQKNVSRRKFLGGSGILGLSAFFSAAPLSSAIASANTSKLLGFEAVPASTADMVTVPKGYKAEPLISWGDPMFSGAPNYDPSGKAPSAHQELQFGDNNDGMSLIALSEDRAILAVNNESTEYGYLFDHKGKNLTLDDVKKAQSAVGVSIIEVHKKNGTWALKRDSKFNRRITANTPIDLTGPAAGHELMKTDADPEGSNVFGTFNNCANGETPWGTYLTCEENFDGFFGGTRDLSLPKDHARYGLKNDEDKFNWHLFDERFDMAKNPQEPHRHGWVVEIDPMNPDSRPKKRTAMGRFKHENAALTINQDGRVVVYMGDDERGEHLYKFVSKNTYDKSSKAANRDLLEEGTLYVAKFKGEIDDFLGKGEWVELSYGTNGLTKENGFADQAEVVTFARRAATHVGATTMDRPEWVAVHPDNQQVFCTLTNNKHRGVKENQPLNAANPRVKNPYGHIIRWTPQNGDHTAKEFSWDIYVMAGNPTVHKAGLGKGTSNVTSENMFNSPDGIGFDRAGRMWIQTDGNYKNKGDFAGMGNNQMLCSDPSTGEIRRFMTGPVACEITGLAFSPDSKAMFVGIQHPGAKGLVSSFPDGGSAKPRSTVVVITREDDGVIGA